MEHPVNKEYEPHHRITRAVDWTVGRVGTLRFFLLQLMITVSWIYAAKSGIPIDNPQLTYLNLGLSVEATLLMILVLISQNRQAAMDRDMAEHDYRVNQEALEILRELRGK